MLMKSDACTMTPPIIGLDFNCTEGWVWIFDSDLSFTLPFFLSVFK